MRERTAQRGSNPWPRLRGALVGVLVATLAAGSAVGAAAAGLAAVPRVPVGYAVSAGGGGLQVRPGRIVYTGDGTGLLAGRSVRARLVWTRWGTQSAAGVGFNQINACRPNCATGRFGGYPVRIVLWRRGVLEHQLVFTRMTIFYTGARPAGEPAHYTFTDLYLSGPGGGYSWGPPRARGYCGGTGRGPHAAGCGNIGSLP